MKQSIRYSYGLRCSLPIKKDTRTYVRVTALNQSHRTDSPERREPPRRAALKADRKTVLTQPADCTLAVATVGEMSRKRRGATDTGSCRRPLEVAAPRL